MTTSPPSAGTARPDPGRLSKRLIWVFCIFLVAILWFVAIEQIAFERRQAVNDAIRQNVNRTMAFEQYVRRTLENADLATRYIAERYARGAAAGEFVGTPGQPATLRGSVGRTGSFLGVVIADARGEVIGTSTTVRPLPRSNVSDLPGFRAHITADTGHLYVSPPNQSIMLRRQVIWLSRRLNDPAGRFAGVVAVVISPEQFTEFYRDASVGPMDVMSVIGLDGITRARRTGRHPSAGENVSGQLVMEMQRRNPNGTYLGPSALDGQIRYFSHRRLPDYKLFVTSGVPESEVLAAPKRRARIFLAGAALLSLLLIAFAASLTIGLGRRERHLAETERANRRLSEAQRIGQIGDWDYDLRSGAVFWSPQLLEMYERDPNGPSPSFDEFKDYLTDEDRVMIDRAHREAIRTGEAQQVEYKITLPSGAESHHASAVIPAFDETGAVVRLHGVDQDVSARKLLDRLQTEVAHLSRLEAMNAMAGTLAHELNQPLAAASNFLAGSRRRLVSGAPTAAEEAEQGIAAAEEKVHLAADIIRRVREMVSNQPKVVTRVSLSQVIDDAIALAALAYPDRKLTVEKRLAADADTVDGDRIQIQQVLVNLIRNAQDATLGQRRPEIIVSSRREDGRVTVAVTDNGPGFSQADDQRFSPFASTKPTGLGLGLSISRTIIESHGGRIWTENGGHGAQVCFTLTAPRQEKAA